MPIPPSCFPLAYPFTHLSKYARTLLDEVLLLFALRRDAKEVEEPWPGLVELGVRLLEVLLRNVRVGEETREERLEPGEAVRLKVGKV
jgi:hypothetical protein